MDTQPSIVAVREAYRILDVVEQTIVRGRFVGEVLTPDGPMHAVSWGSITVYAWESDLQLGINLLKSRRGARNRPSSLYSVPLGRDHDILRRAFDAKTGTQVFGG